MKTFNKKLYIRLDIVQNVLTSCILLISLDQNVSIQFVNNILEILEKFDARIICEDLLYFKIFMNFDNFSCLIF